MIILNEQEIQSFYLMVDAIKDLRDTLIAKADDKVLSPHRTVLDFPKQHASALYMPSADLVGEVAAVKVVTIFPNNPANGLPTTQGVIILTDSVNGQHLALMNASYLTRLRTGALSALATDYLARKDAIILTVIGTGAMAFEQVLGVLAVRDIETILLFNRTVAKAHTFAEQLKDFGVKATIQVVPNVDEAVSKADIINCATRSTVPVFNGDFVKPGTHINGVGSYLPEMREIDIKTILRASKIVVDDLHGVMDEAGEFMNAHGTGVWSFDDVHGELMNVVTDQVVGRENNVEITVFKSVGAAYHDLAVAKGVYLKARKENHGVSMEV